jgi:hypothetical protein
MFPDRENENDHVRGGRRASTPFTRKPSDERLDGKYEEDDDGERRGGAVREPREGGRPVVRTPVRVR